jgi:sugar phosphate isomerase/epimerase
MYRGGSPFEGLRLVAPGALPLLHLNDYPAVPALAAISDGDRVFPGDGIAPLGKIFEFLRETGARPVLSLELFNATYYQQDALEVARRGLAKMRAACGMEPNTRTNG